MGQVAFPELEGVYAEEPAQAHLFRAYQRLHSRMHDAAASGERSAVPPAGKARACFYVTDVHSIFSYLTSEFEFFAAFSPLVEKELAMTTVRLPADTPRCPGFLSVCLRVLCCLCLGWIEELTAATRACVQCTHLVNEWLHQERDKLFLLYTHYWS